MAYTFSTTFAYEHRFFIAGLDFHIGSQKWIYNQDATLVHDDDWVNASAKNKMWGGVFAFVVPQKKMELKMWLGYYPYNKLEFTAPFNPDDQIPLYRGKSYRIGLTFQKKKSMVSWSLDYYRHVFDERSEGGDNADLPGRNQGNSHEKLKSHAIAVSFSWPISLFGGKRRRR
ncbi:MAG: hypothetical protein HOE90_18775 [Bacteriovoracaceae bacterium]|nr:hypothetical protein [Bacteriovoracaceae bacterium]